MSTSPEADMADLNNEGNTILPLSSTFAVAVPINVTIIPIDVLGFLPGDNTHFTLTGKDTESFTFYYTLFHIFPQLFQHSSSREHRPPLQLLPWHAVVPEPSSAPLSGTPTLSTAICSPPHRSRAHTRRPQKKELRQSSFLSRALAMPSCPRYLAIVLLATL